MANTHFDLLAALLGDTPAQLQERIDTQFARLHADTSMPPAPTDAQWQAVTGEPFSATQARVSNPWSGYFDRDGVWID
jgi:hypothetical protein